jgi:hypothetical protein
VILSKNVKMLEIWVKLRVTLNIFLKNHCL